MFAQILTRITGREATAQREAETRLSQRMLDTQRAMDAEDILTAQATWGPQPR